MRLQRSAVQNPGMEERACPPSVRWRLLACALAAGLAAMSGRAVAADCTGALTKLSACTSVDGDVTIGSPGCERVLVDGGRDFFRFRQITVAKNGALCVRNSELAGTHLVVEVGEIIVHGTLEIGSKAAPIGSSNPANKVTIKFTGIALIPKVEEVVQACPDPEFRRGLQLCEGGVLRLFGNKGAPAENSRRLDDTGKVSWTYLSEPAGDPCRFGPNSGAGSPVKIENCAGIGIGGKTIKLAEKVDWQRGDWIVIATSSFSPFETEFAKIESIDATRTLLTLEEPLVYYHFGGADPGPPSPANFNAGQDKNWGVDERAEVGLISRNIELKGDVHDHFSTYGGETIFRKGFQEASNSGRGVFAPRQGEARQLSGALSHARAARTKPGPVQRQHHPSLVQQMHHGAFHREPDDPEQRLCAGGRAPVLPGDRRRGGHHLSIQSRSRRDEPQFQGRRAYGPESEILVAGRQDGELVGAPPTATAVLGAGSFKS